MIRNLLLFLAAFMSCLPLAISNELPQGFPDTHRTKTSLNQDWKFHLGDPEADFFAKDFDDSSWETIHVPHTLALTSLTLDGLQDEKTQLIFHRNVGWYRKSIEVSSHSENKVFIEFEGAHQVTDLWINGKHVGQHAVGGYTPFHFDITDFVEKGKPNQVTLLVDNRRNEVVPPDPGPFDYVKFSGLYRDLYFVETAPVHITFNWESLNSGIYITTPTVDPVNMNATINVKTAVKNEKSSPVECELVTRIIDHQGIVVLKLIDSQKVFPGQEYQFNQIGSLEDNVQLWDTENPYLYRVNSLVRIDGEEIDTLENRLGIRKFELDPVRGFVLNNKPIELIGFNRHQHYGYIGDALPDSLHRKDMLQFKEYGFNIMRTAHYPHDNAILEACDELGILAYEEAPSWISISNEEAWWKNFEKAARTMVRNHRNHPSIVMWGAGINHRGYVPRVHNTIKQEDPIRLTASQGARWTGWQASGLTDINANMLYGPFIWDRSEPIFAMEGRSGPEAVAPQKNDDLMLGLISWTAHAYYTFHPTHDKANDTRDRTRSGAMTVFRYPRPQTQWYKAELLEEPFVFIKEDWNTTTDTATIYSNAAEVELFLNGKSLGRSGPSTNEEYTGLDHPPFHFENIAYEKGHLKAKAYFSNEATLETSVETAKPAYAIELKLDTTGREFTADGSDILVAYAHVVDKNGTTVTTADNLVTFTVDGNATIVGDGADINANPMFTEYGVAPALIRAGTQAGEITITASSDGLKSSQQKVSTVPYSNNTVLAKAQPIFDFETERVDLGANDQLRQFGWNAWNGTDNEESTYSFKNFKGATATISKASDDAIVRWLGEMNVVGKYGFTYGDGVIAIDEAGVNLVFENLPQGTYKLRIWNHAPRSNSDSMDPNKEKLKSLTIHKLPYEKSITIKSSSLVGKDSITAQVSEGKNMQFEEPATTDIIFASDGKSPVSLNLNGKTDKGIWLNAFILSEWEASIN